MVVTCLLPLNNFCVGVDPPATQESDFKWFETLSMRAGEAVRANQLELIAV
jgi:hypothetical protein